eukprot:s5093_g4.t1
MSSGDARTSFETSDEHGSGFLEDDPFSEVGLASFRDLAALENQNLEIEHRDSLLLEESIAFGQSGNDGLGGGEAVEQTAESGLDVGRNFTDFSALDFTSTAVSSSHSMTIPEAIEGYSSDNVFGLARVGLQSDGIKQFWETGFWNDFFDPNKNFLSSFDANFKRPLDPLGGVVGAEPGEVLEREPKIRKPSKVSATFMDHVRDMSIMSWKDQRESEWQVSIHRWHSMLCTCSPTVTIVSQMLVLTGFTAQAQLLVDIFHNRAPSSLLKRCRSMSRMTNYFNDRGRVFPCGEDQIYEFMCVERHNGAPASRLKGYIEAMTFCRHVLGVTMFEDSTVSRRCQGVAALDVHHKVQQAEPLTVRHLEILHRVLFEDSEMWNRAFSGMLLFCVYARARWSDAQHGEKFIEDVDNSGRCAYLEISTGVHKTAKALQLKHVYLPLVAPCIGAAEGNWGEEWCKVRRALGIHSLSEFPLMPAPNADLEPTVRPLTSGEAGPPKSDVELRKQFDEPELSDHATTGTDTESEVETTVRPKVSYRDIEAPNGTAAFASHCDSIDKSNELKGLCVAAELTTFMRMAFAIGTPQSPASDEAFRSFATDLNGGIEPSITMMSLLRRLHFESVTMVVAHLKTNVTTDAGVEGSRKLPPVEKVARLNEQQGRLRGLTIRGELQPSYALVDMVAGLYESEPKIQADTSSELMVQWAFQRRGLAFDQCKLISNEVHEKWVQSLLTQLTRDSPPGYSKVQMDQVLRADRELFTVMAQEHTGPFVNGPKGELPLDLIMTRLMSDPRINMNLLPLPHSASKAAASSSADGETTRAVPKRIVQPKKKFKASAKAKANCPSELKGFNQFDDKGNPICWNFNLSSGCKEETKDGRCKKGVPLHDIMVLEIFAGTARLSRAVRDKGMKSVAVGKDSKRASGIHIATYDLNDPDQLAALCDFIRRHRDVILWAHFAPSCGTASRARGRPLPKLAKLGVKVPKPLRSDLQPLGLDGLSGLDKVKAECANITYESTCVLIQLCFDLAIAVSVENPENSLFWKIPMVRDLLEQLQGYLTVFDNCCHGGTRQKGTAWWSTVDWFQGLAAR